MSLVNMFSDKATIYEGFITQEVFFISQYIDLMENSINKRHTDYKAEILKKEPDIEPELLKYTDPLHKELSKLFRYSILMIVHSFLEEKIIELCEEDTDENEYKTKWESFKKNKKNKGSTLEKSRRFIKEELKRNFPDNNDAWTRIGSVNLIRNCLVHCGGYVYRHQNPRRVEKAINKIDGIDIGAYNRIVIQKDFCSNYLRTINEFLSDLYKNY
ncbi:hypothetical protein MOB66_07045 [Bacillus haynesii]|uniref:hypothetical protein n=1 Tax=Bacillus haynesii TaxID=1925021 RepID=UPI00227D9CF4|nr:hypothetical protein [Bacillus haynesii]MCY7771226.1 hypothetical protein [Bacillus haynesii]MCY8012210.1 hypothetical protein [Bacillus haynesii]MEC0762629.1 hypothetical protein [Bacillus haynesii]MEC0783459.1 hypothetical protein [Bacillus haynesii]